MDTYKVGTTANSTSTMHKLASTPITLNCFETDDYEPELVTSLTPKEGSYFKDNIADEIEESLIPFLEKLRLIYLETKDIRYWKELIRWLPESWLQTRTWTADYAVLRNIYHWRKDHRLQEWHAFCDWASQLPYANELILFDN